MDQLIEFGRRIGEVLPAVVLLVASGYVAVNPAVGAALLARHQLWETNLITQETFGEATPARWLVTVVRLVSLGFFALAVWGLLQVA